MYQKINYFCGVLKKRVARRILNAGKSLIFDKDASVATKF